jgi:hypothetical protein
MRLSELIDRCTGAAPELMIEDGHGIPRPVTEADLGVMLTDSGLPVAYVVLDSADGEG